MTNEDWKNPVYIKLSFSSKNHHHKVPASKKSGRQWDLKELKSL